MQFGLRSVAHGSSDVRGLPDEDSPLRDVNHMCFLVQEFLRRNFSFDCDCIEGWRPLVHVIAAR
jgi:hypothetical protein